MQIVSKRIVDGKNLLFYFYALYFLCLIFLTANLQASEADKPIDAHALMAAAIDQTRGLSSIVELKMVIHRPDWERSSQLKSWTEGRGNALVRFICTRQGCRECHT